MKEFLIPKSEWPEDISKYAKIPRKNKTYLVTNFLNSENYSPKISCKNEEERKSEVLYKSFNKGVKRL